MQRLIASSLAALLAVGTLPYPAFAAGPGGGTPTATPIKHLVVIFGENISFDHYFGTYPNAANPSGEPRFLPKHGTPAVNGLTDALLYNNPNLFNTGNGTGAMNPFRLDRTQAATADQDHNYTPEQEALHFGLMDAFPQYTGNAGPPPPGAPNKGLVMGYYDGNTVTALWNYAQRFAMNDNSFDTNFGPSTPGAINLVSGQTNNVTDQANASADVVEDGGTGFTLIGDADPVGDMCSTTTGAVVQFTGNNIGTMLNAAGITWGFFSGGFDLTAVNSNGTTNCQRSSTSTVTGVTKADYIPHHQPFQYYTTTANPTHARPTSVSTIGVQGDAGNHQYDINDFYAAVNAGNMPSVSFLKAPGYQDAHAGYSDPLDEQTFVVSVINFLQTTKDWDSTAIVISYDDSDGWYDHQMPTIVNQSTTLSDALSGTGMCGTGTASALPGPSGVAHAQGRCGYGPRLPYMVISPFAKENYVSHVMTDQSSTIRFIEDNWLGGERVGDGSFDAIAGRINDMFDFANPNASKFILNETSGEPKK